MPQTLVGPDGQRYEMQEGESPYAAYQRIQASQQATAPPSAPAHVQQDSSSQYEDPGQGYGMVPGGYPQPGLKRKEGSMHPIAKMALEMTAGTVAAFAPVPGSRALAATRFARIPGFLRAARGLEKPGAVQNAVRGGVEGVVSTVPFAEEGERAEAAGWGAGVGAGLGAAIPGVGGAARGLYRMARNLASPEYAAETAAREAIEKAGGRTGELFDVDQNLAAKSAGEAPPEVRDALYDGPESIIEGRQLRGSQRGGETVEGAIPAKTRAGLDEIEASRKVEAEKLYEPVYKEKIPEDTQNFLDNYWARDDVVLARKEAGRILRNEYGEDAIVSPNSVESVHKVLIALREQRDRLKNNEHHDLSRVVGGIYTKISNTMKKSVPGFKGAQEFAEGTFERKDAYTAGGNILNKELLPGVRNTVPYLKAYVKKMKKDPEQLEFFRRGVVEKLVAGIEDSGVEDNVVRLFNHMGTRNKLRAVLPKAQFDAILDFVQKENRYSKTFKATRQKISASAAKGEESQDAIGLGGNIGKAVGWGSLFAYSNLLENLTRTLTGKGGDAYNRELAKYLSGKLLPSPRSTAPIGRAPGVGTLPAVFNDRENLE